ncbi:hypothetical protein [Legionella quateirensis]|uniref:Uncharacterized protein n=1 Tax=Legionella quateirensis TaxID=45072 RepID=A0A378KRM7_9GAMM|nr:hypothetical protein [Legionella quateirensis]KTD53012.1 hypothetical protein Lqua_0845 [Legionella quateirensis]STY17233.1 Uncharacterised protein [Legionella quateirensis]
MNTLIDFYKKKIQELINKNYSLTPFELLIKFLNYINEHDVSPGFFKSSLSAESKNLIQRMSNAQFSPEDVIPVLEQFFCDTTQVRSHCMIYPLAAYFYYFEASYPRARVEGVQQFTFIYTSEETLHQATHLSRKVLLTLRRYTCEIEYQYEAQAKTCRNWRALSQMVLHDKTKYEMGALLINIFSSEVEVKKLGMGLYMKEPDYPLYLLNINYNDETKIAIIRKILTMLSTPDVDESAKSMAFKTLQHIDIPLEMQGNVNDLLVSEFFRSGRYSAEITFRSPLSDKTWDFVLEKVRRNPDIRTLLKVLVLCKKAMSTPKSVLNEALNQFYRQRQITDLLALANIALLLDPEMADNRHKKLLFGNKLISLIETDSRDPTKAGDLLIRIMHPLPLTQEQCKQLEQLLLLKTSEQDKLAILSILCKALEKKLLPSVFKEALLKHIQKFCFEEYPSSFSPLLYSTLDSLLSPQQRCDLFSRLTFSGHPPLARVCLYILPPPEMFDVYQTMLAKPWDLNFLNSTIRDLDHRPNTKILSIIALPLLEIGREMFTNKALPSTTRQHAQSLIQKIKQMVKTPEVHEYCFTLFMDLLRSGKEHHGFQEQIIHLAHQIWPTNENVQHDAVHAYFSFLNQNINRFDHNDFRTIVASLNRILIKIEQPEVRSIILVNLDNILLNIHDNFTSTALQQGIEQLRSTHELKSIVDNLISEDLKTYVYDDSDASQDIDLYKI